MSQKGRVLIADDMHQCIIPLLKEQGFDPVYSPTIFRSEILDIIKDFDGLIIRSKTAVDKELIDQALRLKFVARAGAGMDKVDEGYLKEKGITTLNAPEGNRDAVGEHTLGMLLSLLHKISAAYREVQHGIWDREKHRGIELKGKVVGIYGVGNMGSSFARKLRGFDCEVLGYDRYKTGFGEDLNIKEVDLDEFFAEVEILSIHIPLFFDTKRLFNADYLSKFKNLKVVLNTSRGEILDLNALKDLLADDKVFGAGLDVLENEKFDQLSKGEKELLDQLTSFPNVLISPHVAGWTFESYQRISEVIAEKIARLP